MKNRSWSLPKQFQNWLIPHTHQSLKAIWLTKHVKTFKTRLEHWKRKTSKESATNWRWFLSSKCMNWKEKPTKSCILSFINWKCIYLWAHLSVRWWNKLKIWGENSCLWKIACYVWNLLLCFKRYNALSATSYWHWAERI